MQSNTVLIVAIPVLFLFAGGLVIATTASRSRSTTARLSREAVRKDRSAVGLPGGPDLDAEAAKRYDQVKDALVSAEPPTPWAPPDREQLGVTRRQFLNRGILTLTGLSVATFGASALGFLYTTLGGGFGGKIRSGKLDEILATLAATKDPVYIADAKSYLVPYPKSAIPNAKKAYPASVIPGMEAGLVALYQKCPHLGCRVPWCNSSQWFECPCHGSKYNRVGEKKAGPAPRGMDRWPVEIAGGDVVINTGLSILGPPIGINTTGQEAEGPLCV